MALCEHYELPEEMCAHCQGSEPPFVPVIPPEVAALMLRRRIEAKEGYWSDEAQKRRIFRTRFCPNHLPSGRKVKIPSEARQCLRCEVLDRAFAQAGVDIFFMLDLSDEPELESYRPYGATSTYRRRARSTTAPFGTLFADDPPLSGQVPSA